MESAFFFNIGSTDAVLDQVQAVTGIPLPDNPIALSGILELKAIQQRTDGLARNGLKKVGGYQKLIIGEKRHSVLARQAGGDRPAALVGFSQLSAGQNDVRITAMLAGPFNVAGKKVPVLLGAGIYAQTDRCVGLKHIGGAERDAGGSPVNDINKPDFRLDCQGCSGDILCAFEIDYAHFRWVQFFSGLSPATVDHAHGIKAFAGMRVQKQCSGELGIEDGLGGDGDNQDGAIRVIDEHVLSEQIPLLFIVAENAAECK